MPRLPAASLNAMVQAVFVPGTTYKLALFTGDPDSVGTTGEVTGGSYTRQNIVFTSASNGIEYNTTPITFSGMPALAAIPFIAIFTSGGSYMGGGASGFAGSVGTGGTITFPAGAIAVAQV